MSPSKTLGYSPKGSLHSVIHFCPLLVPSAFMDEENKVFSFAQPPKSSKEELIPIQSSFIHTHFTSHIFPDLLLPVSMLSRKKSSFGRFVLTANHQLLLSWEIYLVPSYWQQLSTDDRHGAVPQGAAALKEADIIPCPASLKIILVSAWIKVEWLYYRHKLPQNLS